MELETNKKIFARLNKILKGSDGIIYLMFAGRETYAAKVQGRLVGTIYKHSANVNQAVERLLKHKAEFLIFKRKQREYGSRGREAENYTSNLDPVYLTLKSLGVEFNQEELESVLVQLSEANDYFPKYLTNVFEVSVLRTLSWNSLLSMYLTFLVGVLKSSGLVVYPMPSDFSIDKGKVAPLLGKNPNLKTELSTISMQVSSPGLGLNPQFKAHLGKVLNGLENLESYSLGLVEFLNELKEMGITDFSDLASRFREGMTQLEQVKTLAENLKELDHQIEKVEKSKESK